MRIVCWFFFLCCTLKSLAQQTVTGTVTNNRQQPIPGATITVNNRIAANTNTAGQFSISVPNGKHQLQISNIGYQTLDTIVHINGSVHLKFSLQTLAKNLDEVAVVQQTTTRTVKEKEFATEVVDLKLIRNRNTDINRLLNALPGIRVRETGGMGSDFNYSIQGLTGKAIRFFVDGIPMENFGAGFNVNNYPVAALERIEVYKGVTPIELSGDALGGAVHLVTRKEIRNFLDLSYSVGSFGTHKLQLIGKWRHKSGFTTQLTTAWNKSNNNYKVWGNTVEIADANGRPITGKKYKRFNDDFEAASVKLAIGFTGKKWADELLLELAYSDMEKGLQTGRTMAFVYGKVRYNETFTMPSLRYNKDNFLLPGLKLNLYSAFNRREGQTIDTSSIKYNWAGDSIATTTGELNGIRAQRSRYTFTDLTFLQLINGSYQLSANHTIAINYSLNHQHRKGKDAIALADWTIPLRQPQQLTKQITGLSYQAQFFEQAWTNSLFLKRFQYAASASVYDYNGGAQRELIKKERKEGHWGFGHAAKLNWGKAILIKYSGEKATRLPDAVELMGDGNTILHAPQLKPEQSTNFNAGILYKIERTNWRMDVETGLFARFTKDLIWLGEGDLYGTARYENISKIRSTGVDASLRYRNKKWFTATGNLTFQNIRNRQRRTSSGAPNIVFNDRMKNMPAWMANTEFRFRFPASLKHHHIDFYIANNYVEGFYLNWPKLGNRATKKRIPEQFTQDIGISYSFPENRFVLSAECRNLLNKQVFDNYLLQKPGRYIGLQFRCFLQQQNK